jgi:hypothetical protein
MLVVVPALSLAERKPVECPPACPFHCPVCEDVVLLYGDDLIIMHHDCSADGRGYAEVRSEMTKEMQLRELHRGLEVLEREAVTHAAQPKGARVANAIINLLEQVKVLRSS